jgi:predicted nucleotidyltransferase
MSPNLSKNEDTDDEMICTIDEIKRIVAPIAERHGIGKVWLFGSYARGDATTESDIDLHIEKGKITDSYELTALYLYLDLQEALNSELNMVTTESIWDDFMDEILREEILIYG